MLKPRNEVLIGSVDLRAHMRKALASRRDQAFSKFKVYILLSDIIHNEEFFSTRIPEVDPVELRRIICGLHDHFYRISECYSRLPPDRYLVRPPLDTEDPGGFHGKPSHGLNAGGYFYIEDYGFGTVLNPKVAPSLQLRTIELARNYLHDSLHSATARSMHGLEDGQFHRYRYGINLRGQNGIGFSPLQASEDGRTVNLNVLMEGLIQKMVGDAIAKLCPQDQANYTDPLKVGPLERALWSDITLCRAPADGYPDELAGMKAFHDEIMTPTLRFLTYWQKRYAMHFPNGQPFEELLLCAMISGDLNGIREVFDILEYGECRGGQAWNEILRHPGFQEMIEDLNEMEPLLEDSNFITPFGYIPAA